MINKYKIKKSQKALFAIVCFYWGYSFDTAPANAFISQELHTEDIPQVYKKDEKCIERKSRRVQVLMKPSTHKKLESGKNNGQSINDFINQILDNYLDN